MKINWAIILPLLLIPLAYAIYLYPQLPNTIPTHFGISGKPDAWGKKSSIFAAPLILAMVNLFILVLIANLDKIDPKANQANNFLDSSVRLMYLLTGFLSLLSFLIVYSSSHQDFPIDRLLIPTIGLFFFLMGRMFINLKPNYFIGVRLPWTLSSDDNWKKTHEFSSKYWQAGGIGIIIAGLILPNPWNFISFLGIIAIIVIIPCIYSFKYYKNNPD